MLIKQEMVMYKTEHSDQSTMTWFVEDANECPPRSVQMFLVDWKDMGSPEVITLTIEPGDLLNSSEK